VCDCVKYNIIEHDGLVLCNLSVWHTKTTGV